MNTLTTTWAPSVPDEVASATPMTRAPSSSVWPQFLTGQTDQPVRVIVVDDDAHMRRVISQELLADARIHLVGQASSLREGKRLVSLHEFDVLLVDLNLNRPGNCGGWLV